MTYFYGTMRRLVSGVESAGPGIAATIGFQDWCTNVSYQATRQVQNISEFSGATNDITDMVELNHFWKVTVDQYLRMQGLGINALACLLGGGDTISGSGPYFHALALNQTGNFVKTKSLWLDDGSGSIQWFPAATVESWKLDWNTTSDANKVEVGLCSFSPLTSASSYYVAPPTYPNLTSVNSQTAGRVGRAVNVQYQVYNGAGSAAYSSNPESGSITIQRNTTPFFGQSFGSAGATGINPFTMPTDLLATGGPNQDPLNPAALVSGPAGVTGQFQAVFDGSAYANPYNDYVNFRELIGASATATAPASAPSAATVPTGTLTGTYAYKVTFLTSQGETTPGTASGSVSPSNQKVSLTAIPTGGTGVIGRRIYRQSGGSGSYFLLATILDNVTTTYTDNAGVSTAVAPISNTATYLPQHRLIFYEGLTQQYYLELDLGPMRFGDVQVDGSQHPIRVTLPFTAYSDAASVSIGNDGVAYNNLVSAIVKSPMSTKIL